MALTQIIGQDTAVAALLSAITRDAVPQTYLFVGPDGVGKTMAAIEFAKALDCRSRRPNGDCCDVCVNCTRISAGEHPDVTRIAPDGEFTKIWQFWTRSGHVLGALETLPFAPVAGRVRFYLVERAETLNDESANSLLKALEEPPPYVQFVLCAPSPNAVLPTILSRSQLLRFRQVPTATIAETLVQRRGLALNEARILAAYSEGAPGRGLRLADQPELREQRDSLLDLAARIATSPGIAAFRLAEDLRNVSKPAKGKKAAADGDADTDAPDRNMRGDLGRSLNVLATWHSDLLSVALRGKDAPVIHEDRRSALVQAAARYRPEQLAENIEHLMTFRRHIARNANAQLATEVLVFEAGAEGKGRFSTAGRIKGPMREAKVGAAGLVEYIRSVCAEREVPGIGIAIIKDGETILQAGVGVRDIDGQALVDANTLFAIASNTKAFTAAALAILVDEGKLNWDDPVVNRLSGFQMYDPYVTHEITVRDLLCHRSGLGLGQGDLLVFPQSTYTRDEIVYKQRFLKPKTSFRSRYAYDNLLYLVAGQIIPAVTGQAWERFIEDRLFAPLGMVDSTTGVRGFRPGDNVATPHGRVGGIVQPVTRTDMDNAAPAGAINSSVADMARWVLTLLGNGKIPGGDSERLLFSARQSAEMWSPQTIIPIEPPAENGLPRSTFAAYGLGWRMCDYQGRKLVSHTGGLSGMLSRVTLVPEEGLGIVVLTNQEDGVAYQAITYHVLDLFLNWKPSPWLDLFKAAHDKQVAEAAEVTAKQSATRAIDSKPALPLSGYAGRYVDVWYGTITITEENSGLVIRFDATPGLVGDLEHFQYDTFIARWRNRALDADAFVTFSLKPSGAIDTMKMAAVSPLTDFSFDWHDLLFVPVAG